MNYIISKLNKFILAAMFSLTFIFFCLYFVRPVYAFLFVSWGDTKTGTATLQAESTQAKPLNPNFTIYTGDLVDTTSNPTMNTLDPWKAALNGGTNNGMFDITFPVRGNHDSNMNTIWLTYFNLGGVASHIGATNYTELNQNTTYSFDYGNSHFVGIDVLGDVTYMSAAQIAWLDTDLTNATNRGLTHAFLFWHGPVYCVAEHCSPPPVAPASLITVINNHPIVAATFHGHEHVLAYVHMDSSRDAGLTKHSFEEFVTGAGGANNNYDCVASRTVGPSDWCISRIFGFMTIAVSGTSISVNTYQVGNTTPIKTQTFTHGSSGGDTTAPTAPTNLVATAASATQVNLSWTASTDNVAVTGYKVFRGGSQIGTSTTNSYTDSTVQAATSYNYYVTAYDAAGNNSAASNTTSATTPCAAIPTDKGVATTTISISTAGTYKIWSRIMAPDATNNSYILQVVGNDCGTVVGDSNTAIAANTWTWVDYKDASASSKITTTFLTNGSYTINMIGRETGVKLDRVIFTTDQTCVPIDNGDNCVSQTVDTTPPVRSNGTPSGALPAGTTQTTISLNTDEPATCKYATSAGVSYASMSNTFSTTGNTSHSTTATGLTNGGSYKYYVRCQDKASTPNANQNDYLISFTVNQTVDTTPPVRSNGSPSGALAAGTTQATLSLTTDEDATCKYATSPGVYYTNMPNTFTTTGSTSHSTTVTGLTNGGSYNYYVRCRDKASSTPNSNQDDYPISFSVASTPSVKIGDLNGDNNVDAADLLILVNRWGTNDATADLNKNGSVDVFDLSILLSNWGS
jgi:chitodextrinase